MLNRFLHILSFSILFCGTSYGQLSKISFSVNNFVHQKSQFTFLNEVDTKDAFLESTFTFGQHYILTKEKKLGNKLALQYGLGLGYTRIAYRYKRSEEFLSIGRNNRFIEKRGGSSNTMFVAPVGLLYKLFDKKKSVLYFNINLKTIYALRTDIRFSASVSNETTNKLVYIARTPINNENSIDFTLGAEIDYRRQILESPFWWKVALNYNHALTEYYSGTGTLFGDAENLEIEIENRLTHFGISLGILRSL